MITLIAQYKAERMVVQAMKKRRHSFLYYLILLVGSYVLIYSPAAGDTGRRVDSKPLTILSDATGEIEEILLQFSAPLSEDLLTIYESLLKNIDPETRIFFVCEEAGQIHRLKSLLGMWGIVDRERIHFVNADMTISAWARDRFLVKASKDDQCARELLVPKISLKEGTDWINDREIPWLFADRSGERVAVTPSKFYLEGGDIVSSGSNIFTSYSTVMKQSGDLDPGVVGRMEEELGNKIVVIGGPDVSAPLWHIDMYLTPISDTTVLLAEPVDEKVMWKAGEGYTIVKDDAGTSTGSLRQSAEWEMILSPPPKTMNSYDNVRVQLEARGFHVERIPIIHNEDHGVVTYNNVLMEERNQRRIVYMPVYGFEELDRIAENKYQSLGFEVRRVNASSLYQYDGSLRCIVNVLARDIHLLPSSLDPLLGSGQRVMPRNPSPIEY
ncbi:agmatine deiminase family protein [Thermodesulfobacteriota bacterium]